MLRSGSQDAKAADTREALIVAGLKLFGELGFDGTSTRAIANEAKVNAAMIAYAGWRRLAAGQAEDTAIDVLPRWPLDRLSAVD